MGKDKVKRQARPPRREPARVALAAADRSEGALPSFPGFLASLPVGTPEIFVIARCPAMRNHRPSLPHFPHAGAGSGLWIPGAQSLSSQNDDAAGAVEVDDDLARVMARLVKHNTATRLKALATSSTCARDARAAAAAAGTRPPRRRTHDPRGAAAALPQWTLATAKSTWTTPRRQSRVGEDGGCRWRRRQGPGEAPRRLAPSWWFAAHDPDETVAREALGAQCFHRREPQRPAVRPRPRF